MVNKYNWVDNPTVSQVSEYNPDILNENLMHLKYDNIPANVTPFSFNNGNVNALGKADIVDSQLSTDLVFSQSGTYTVNIPESGNYDVVAIGGGAGGAWGMDVYAIRSSASGGSGAGFVGNIYIPAGTYTCRVGNGGSPAGNGGTGGAGGATEIVGILLANGGSAGAYATWGQRNSSTGGILSVNTTINSSTLCSNGNNGTTAYNGSSQGGASLLNGFGKGGSATITSSEFGTAGYLAIKMSGQSYINYKIGGSYPVVKGSLADGTQFIVNGLNSDDASFLADGTYIKYVGEGGSSELLKTSLYRQPKTPACNVGDIWFNTSSEPCIASKWNGVQFVAYNKVPLCWFTVASGTVSAYGTYPYNQNGYNITKNNVPPVSLPNMNVSWWTAISFPYVVPKDGWLSLQGYNSDGQSIGWCIVGNYPLVNFAACCARGWVPVRKGLQILQTGTGRLDPCYFIPAEGAV